MSASDNLSKPQFRLFHGTNASIKPGEWIEPEKAKGFAANDSDYKVAHATPNVLHAATHGSRVYEVAHSSEQEQWSPGHFVSGEGFQVKKEISPKVLKRIKKK
jgi:hypothetical protein